MTVEATARQINDDSKATPNEKLLAWAVLDLLQKSEQAYNRSQWAAAQIEKLAARSGVQLDPRA